MVHFYSFSFRKAVDYVNNENYADYGGNASPCASQTRLAMAKKQPNQQT